jgi:hypothetical protein
VALGRGVRGAGWRRAPRPRSRRSRVPHRAARRRRSHAQQRWSRRVRGPPGRHKRQRSLCADPGARGGMAASRARGWIAYRAAGVAHALPAGPGEKRAPLCTPPTRHARSRATGRQRRQGGVVRGRRRLGLDAPRRHGARVDAAPHRRRQRRGRRGRRRRRRFGRNAGQRDVGRQRHPRRQQRHLWVRAGAGLTWGELCWWKVCRSASLVRLLEGSGAAQPAWRRRPMSRATAARARHLMERRPLPTQSRAARAARNLGSGGLVEGATVARSRGANEAGACRRVAPYVGLRQLLQQPWHDPASPSPPPSPPILDCDQTTPQAPRPWAEPAAARGSAQSPINLVQGGTRAGSPGAPPASDQPRLFSPQLHWRRARATPLPATALAAAAARLPAAPPLICRRAVWPGAGCAAKCRP